MQALLFVALAATSTELSGLYLAGLAPSPELAFVLQITAIGTALGSGVAARAKRRNADADTWLITTAWATRGSWSASGSSPPRSSSDLIGRYTHANRRFACQVGRMARDSVFDSGTLGANASNVINRGTINQLDDELWVLVVPTLAVARLGEADHHGWWRSNGASSTGAFVLEDRFPRTRRVLGLEIALVAAERRHVEEFGEQGDFVHLFSASLGAARLARAWLAERKTESAEVELVGALHAQSTSELEALIPPLDQRTDQVVFGGRARIGEITAEELRDLRRRGQTVQLLARAFVDAPQALPYLEAVGAS